MLRKKPVYLSLCLLLAACSVASAAPKTQPPIQEYSAYTGQYSSKGSTGPFSLTVEYRDQNVWGGTVYLNAPRYTKAHWTGVITGSKIEIFWAYGSEFRGGAVGRFNKDFSKMTGTLNNTYSFYGNATTINTKFSISGVK